MVLEHTGDHASQWAAITSVAAKPWCSGETPRKWVRRAERDAGKRSGPSADEQARVNALEREVKELRRANESLRKASAYCAQAAVDFEPPAHPAGASRSVIGMVPCRLARTSSCSEALGCS